MRRLRGSRWFGRPTDEADAEIREHLRLRVDELVAEGMSESRARQQAEREFGDVERIRRECRGVQRQIRNRRSWRRLIEATTGDLRFAARILAARPLTSLVIVLILALGIGSVTGVLSVVNALFLKPLPGVRDPGAIVEVVQGRSSDEFVSVSYPVLRNLQRRASGAVEEAATVPPISHIAGFDFATLALAGAGETPEVLFGLQVTDDYFEVLGTRPAHGNLLPRVGDRLPAPAVAVVSHALWERRFGADPAVVGSEVRLNGSPTTIVGVAERGFQGHAVAIQVDLWVPSGAPIAGLHSPESMEHPRNGMFDALGRLTEGVDRREAAEWAQAMTTGFIQDLEGPDAQYPLRLGRYANVPGLARVGLTTFLAALMVIAGTVLTITCVNVTSLQLSRGLQRAEEFAVRASLGAGRARIVRQLVLESLCLFVPAALLGGTLSGVVVRRLTTSPETLPLPGLRLALDVGADARLLLAVASLTLLVGLLASLGPAWRASRSDFAQALRSSDGGGPAGRFRLRDWLVGAQVGATVLLLIVGGLFARSLGAIAARDLGFESSHVTVATLDLELAGYTPEAGAALWPEVLEAARSLPGVESAALAHKLPLSSRSTTGVFVPGREAAEGVPTFALSNRRVSDGYFETLGVRVLRGRAITAADRAGTGDVVVLNETMARRLWPEGQPLGRTLYRGASAEGRPYTVVGIAEDGVYHDLDEPTPGFGWFASSQHLEAGMILHLRGEAGTRLTREQLTEALEGVVPGLPILSFASLEDSLQLHFVGQRIAAWVAGTLALAGALLTAFGVYGLTAFRAARKQREIGVRKALGATDGDVVRTTLLEGIRAPAVGLLAGGLAAALLVRLLASLLVGVDTGDPITFVGVAVSVLALCSIAVWLPARRAARLDPARTLRAD